MIRKAVYPMTILLALTLIVVGSPAVTAADPSTQDQCIACHLDVEDEVALAYQNDVHYTHNISCADCHGGDRTADDEDLAMDPQKGYIGVPKGDAVTDVCLQCHASADRMKSFGSAINTKPFTLFRQSVHGPSQITTCITCHGVHHIRSKSDPFSPVYPLNQIETCGRCHNNPDYMKKFNPALPTDQVAKYWTSQHGKQLKNGDTRVATCASCHGNHDIFPVKDPRSRVYALNLPETCGQCHNDPKLMRIYHLPGDILDQYARGVHGKALLDKHDTGAPACNDCHGNHGAVPPGVESINFICGNCHVQNAEYFRQSPHEKAFRENDFHQCATCHEHHDIQKPTDDLLNVKADSVCSDCHSEDENAWTVAGQMYNTIIRLVQKARLAEDLLREAEEKGMDVEDARFKFKDLNQALIQARTLTHTLDPRQVEEKVKPALKLADDITANARSAIHEYYYRRRGLLIATLFITLLAVALYLKIREIERKQHE